MPPPLVCETDRDLSSLGSHQFHESECGKFLQLPSFQEAFPNLSDQPQNVLPPAPIIHIATESHPPTTAPPTLIQTTSFTTPFTAAPQTEPDQPVQSVTDPPLIPAPDGRIRMSVMTMVIVIVIVTMAVVVD